MELFHASCRSIYKWSQFIVDTEVIHFSVRLWLVMDFFSTVHAILIVLTLPLPTRHYHTRYVLIWIRLNGSKVPNKLANCFRHRWCILPCCNSHKLSISEFSAFFEFSSATVYDASVPLWDQAPRIVIIAFSCHNY